MGTIYRLNGKVVTERAFMRKTLGIKAGVKQINTSGAWPIISDAMSVLPEQVAEAQALDRSLGVHAEYRDGRPVLESRTHRKEFLEAHGMYDRSGGYGDAQRRK